MKILASFITRILGFKFIKFYNENITLFNFPMFFLPIDIYKILIIEMTKVLGLEKTKEIFNTVAYTQSVFAVDLFKKKFNIKANEKDFSFFFEQMSSIGLGNPEVKSISKDNNNIKIKIKNSVVFENDIHDFYIEGLFLGAGYSILNKNYDIKISKIDSETISLDLKPTPQKKEYLSSIENYNFKNLVLPKQNNKENTFMQKLKKINPKYLVIKKEGTYLHNNKYFFTLMSVFVSIYYLSIKENIKCRELFFNIGELFAKSSYNQFSKIINTKNKQEFYNLISLFGFGIIEPIIIKKNYLKINIPESAFENTSKKLFPKQYSTSHNDFKIGFLKELFCISNEVNPKNVEINLRTNNKKLIATFKVSQRL